MNFLRNNVMQKIVVSISFLGFCGQCLCSEEIASDNAIEENVAFVSPYKSIYLSFYLFSDAALSSNGKRIVTRRRHGKIVLWESETGASSQVFDFGSKAQIRVVAYSPYEPLVWIGSSSGEVYAIDLLGSRIETKVKLETPIISLAPSPNGNILAIGSAGGKVHFLNTKSSQIITEIGVGSPVLALAFNGNGDMLATGSTDGIVRAWSVRTGEEKFQLKQMEAPITNVALNSENNIVFAASSIAIYLWDAETKKLVHEIKKGDCCFNSAALSPNGKLVIIGSSDGIATFYDAKTGSSVLSVQQDVGSDEDPGRDSISSVSFSDDGTTLLIQTETQLSLWKIDYA